MLPFLKTQIPGPRSRALAKLLRRYEAPTVTYISSKGPIFWERGRGVNVWDVDGNRYLDLTSAFGVASLGHSHPKVMVAIQKQSKFLSHAMGDVHPARLKAELCARLSGITFERWTKHKQSGQVFLCNSGFEAVEAALKTARLFTGRRGVIAFEGAYHGLGYGALEATWRPDFRRPFMDQLGHFVEFVRYPRRRKKQEQEEEELKGVEQHIRFVLQKGAIGAILVEPCQGRGGEVIPPAGFLPMLRHICDRNHILLIADEIYVGFWRTGRWFAVEHSGVTPDLICVGKALTGSLPLSACIGRSDIMAAWPRSTGEALHTSTFLGNPLACAAALASICEFESAAPGWKILKKGEKWREMLSLHLNTTPGIKEIRGIGLMIGIEFMPNASLSPSTVCELLLARGIIALPSGSKNEVLALAPPLVTGDQTLEWSARQIAEVAGA